MRVLVPFLVMALLAVVPAEVRGGSPGEEQPSLVAEASNRFALNFYAQLAKSSRGNLFFSPSSLSFALTMAAAGARGQTQAEMTEVLCLGNQLDRVHGEYRQLLAKWEEASKDRFRYKLHMASRLWIQSKYPVEDEFRRLTRTEYRAAIGSVDFEGNPERSRGTINQWISKQTERKILDLLPEGSIDKNTRLVLTNAAYFKAQWSRRFLDTQDEDFFVAPERSVKVPMMNQMGMSRYMYMETPDLQIIELPYGEGGGEMSMVVLLPREKGGLAALEKSLSAEKLAERLGQLKMEDKEVFLPKFVIDNRLDLDAILKAMGMRLAFAADGPDFSGISGQKDLRITKVAQKAMVAVDESGTEVAVGTYTMMGMLGMPQHATIFRADHPFVFLIRDMKTGYILFMGRLADPSV